MTEQSQVKCSLCQGSIGKYMENFKIKIFGYCMECLPKGTCWAEVTSNRASNCEKIEPVALTVIAS